MKRQWTDAIDISLAKSTLAMPESRRRGIKHRKPANQGNWRPVQSPTKATGKKQNVHQLELETPRSAARKTTVPAPIYGPLRFVPPSEISKGSVHGKKRSVFRHRISLSSSETSRQQITLSASRTRSQHLSAGSQRKRLQTVSSPLAFRAAESFGQQPHVRNARHSLEASDALDDGEQRWQGSEGSAVERQNATSARISALATTQSRLPDQWESPTIQRSKFGGRLGEAVEVQKSQIKAHQPGSRNRANIDLAETRTSAPSGLPEHTASSKRPFLETPRLTHQSNQPMTASHGNGKATSFRKLAGTFRPSSAVLQHPEILLGLLESRGEYTRPVLVEDFAHYTLLHDFLVPQNPSKNIALYLFVAQRRPKAERSQGPTDVKPSQTSRRCPRYRNPAMLALRVDHRRERHRRRARIVKWRRQTRAYPFLRYPW